MNTQQQQVNHYRDLLNDIPAELRRYSTILEAVDDSKLDDAKMVALGEAMEKALEALDTIHRMTV